MSSWRSDSGWYGRGRGYGWRGGGQQRRGAASGGGGINDGVVEVGGRDSEPERGCGIDAEPAVLRGGGRGRRGRGARGGVGTGLGRGIGVAHTEPAGEGEGDSGRHLVGTKRRWPAWEEEQGRDEGEGENAAAAEEDTGVWKEPPEAMELPATYRRVLGVELHVANRIVLHQLEGAKTLAVVQGRIYVDLEEPSKYLDGALVHCLQIGAQEVFLAQPRPEWTFSKKKRAPETPQYLEDPLCRRVVGFHKNDERQALCEHFSNHRITLERERVHKTNGHFYINFSNQQQMDSAKYTIHRTGRIIFTVKPESEFMLPFLSPQYIHRQPQSKVPRVITNIPPNIKPVLLKLKTKPPTANTQNTCKELEHEDCEVRQWVKVQMEYLKSLETVKLFNSLDEAQSSTRALHDIEVAARSKDSSMKRLKDKIQLLQGGPALIGKDTDGDGPTFLEIKPSVYKIRGIFEALEKDLSAKIQNSIVIADTEAPTEQTYNEFIGLLTSLTSLVDSTCGELTREAHIFCKSDADQLQAVITKIEKKLDPRAKEVIRLVELFNQLLGTLSYEDSDKYHTFSRQWGNYRERMAKFLREIDTWRQNNNKLHLEEASTGRRQETEPGTTACVSPQPHKQPPHQQQSQQQPPRVGHTNGTPMPHQHQDRSLPRPHVTLPGTPPTTATSPAAVVITIHDDDSPTTTPPPPQAPQHRPHRRYPSAQQPQLQPRHHHNNNNNRSNHHNDSSSTTSTTTAPTTAVAPKQNREPASSHSEDGSEVGAEGRFHAALTDSSTPCPQCCTPQPFSAFPALCTVTLVADLLTIYYEGQWMPLTNGVQCQALPAIHPIHLGTNTPCFFSCMCTLATFPTETEAKPFRNCSSLTCDLIT
ncbi:hypothetical protein Pelo_4523 [Pelomyxa schiedti]|nr:hypothetical protein Pelo_4523 [Pelomyxa schiedti]